jgi:hypothetical protein
MLQNIKQYLKKIAQPLHGHALPGDLHEEDAALITRIRDDRLTYLSDTKLVALANTCRDIEEDGLPGIFIEAGCALGGSAILIASIKDRHRAFHVYDVFGMIPPPSDHDTDDVHDRYKTIVEGKSTGIDGDEYYGYKNNLYEEVQDNFQQYGIDTKKESIWLIKGLLQDTLHLTHSVALAHIDVDWYEPVMTCLQRIFPRLVVGGSIILDDYYDWGGCRKATDEYLKTVHGQFSLDDSAGSLKITRVRHALD